MLLIVTGVVLLVTATGWFASMLASTMYPEALEQSHFDMEFSRIVNRLGAEDR